MLDVNAALGTLITVMTKDNWSKIMETSMIGCRHIGYKSGYPKFDNQCGSDIDGKGLGWIAAWYFIIYVVISSMVISNLLVGVIISSMDLLRKQYKEEVEIWYRVNKIKTVYDLADITIDRMLELWELLDDNGNGFLTFEESIPIMDILDISRSKRFQFFQKVDKHSRGQIDFSEFCEMLCELKKGILRIITSDKANSRSTITNNIQITVRKSSIHNSSVTDRRNIGKFLRRSSSAQGESFLSQPQPRYFPHQKL